ncbi:hypothetical protein MTR67_007883 [Solanum verrucosum]|uniref:Tf2-1-like SH3-like domain-containing protein n=1 Tax=Solanum verrucosum TaxID=315347 RepID=A0AAF0TFY1_SOLVR|nr:hypothetical protein MTR67_007883 [Solanum verrucosum]
MRQEKKKQGFVKIVMDFIGGEKSNFWGKGLGRRASQRPPKGTLKPSPWGGAPSRAPSRPSEVWRLAPRASQSAKDAKFSHSFPTFSYMFLAPPILKKERKERVSKRCAQTGTPGSQTYRFRRRRNRGDEQGRVITSVRSRRSLFGWFEVSEAGLIDPELLHQAMEKGVIRIGKEGKLSPRFMGPYRIVKRIGNVA